MKRISISCLFLVLLCACTTDHTLTVYQTDPLVKIIHTDSVFTDLADTAFVARGETAAFQFVVQSDAPVDSLQASVALVGLGKTRIGWVHDVLSTNPVADCPDAILSPDNMYPDPIIDDARESLTHAADHKTLVVDVDIPRDARPGIYKGKLTVTALKADKVVRISKTFHIQVYPVTLPEEQGLKVVNHTGTFAPMNDGEPVEVFSDRWYHLLQLVAEMAADYGQNCWLAPAKPKVVLNADGTDFDIDFEEFDRVLQLLQEHGNMQYFCNSYMGGRPAGWDDAFNFTGVYVRDGQLVSEAMDYDDPRLETYINRYYGLMEEHLRQRGWIGRCYQHVADEPSLKGTDSQKSWSHVSRLVKNAAPSMRTIDACFEIVESQDVSVVQLSSNIATMPPVPEDCERWMYTCCGPQGNYANRFVAQPLLKTRILHWINYKYDECGYLHWGLTRWENCPDPLHDVTPVGQTWPGGDCYILYPGHDKVYPSLRARAMRDGIHDYDLLRMVAARDKAKAEQFCSSIVQGPDSYQLSTAHFRQVHRQMLHYLSQPEAQP